MAVQAGTSTAPTKAGPRQAAPSEGDRSQLKGLILSGGKGSRLRPFTYTNAKQLVPIANKPILFYAIEQLVECGIRDIGIVVGDTAEQVQAAVGDGSDFGASIRYIPQDAPLGIAHAVKIAQDYLRGSPFVMYLGDNFVLGGIGHLVETFRGNGANCQILLHPVTNPQAFGIAEMSEGRVVRVVEKPSQPVTNLAVIGIYMFDKNVFQAVEQLKPSARGELEITDTIQYLIDNGFSVKAEVLDHYWIDTGKMDDILEANRVILGTLTPRIEGEVDERSRLYDCVVLERGSSVRNSVIRGPAIIGPGSQVEDCYVGPHTSIGTGCRIKGARIANSIIMEQTVIEDIHWPLEQSLIGRNVQLRGGPNVGGSYSLTLGDHSQINMPGN
ncbi:MAG TPA: glucose-1-phosphate thymidylyltransferase [Dehalococcoidia bacterium]|nr:glucose-1-phosphate thymidylyltransferase [Dehalococcoidia bacterium]